MENNKNVDIKEINEKIEKESAFIDLLVLEINKVIIGQINPNNCIQSRRKESYLRCIDCRDYCLSIYTFWLFATSILSFIWYNFLNFINDFFF